jgi:hypothetical protein
MTLIAFTKILSGAVWLALILLISICMVLTITILLQTKSSVTLGVSFSLYLLAHQRTDVVAAIAKSDTQQGFPLDMLVPFAL